MKFRKPYYLFSSYGNKCSGRKPSQICKSKLRTTGSRGHLLNNGSNEQHHAVLERLSVVRGDKQMVISTYLLRIEWRINRKKKDSQWMGDIGNWDDRDWFELMCV